MIGKRQFLIGISAIVLVATTGLFGVSLAHATWNGQPYSPGSTLNPECGPTDPGCSIASTTLQSAYASGNGIVAIDGRDITFTLPDTTTDPNLIVNLAGQGSFQIQNNGTTVDSFAANGTLTVANVINNGLTANSLVYANGSKQISSVTMNGPITFTGGTLAINQSTNSTDGYLSAGDWTTFNAKQNAITPGTGLSMTGNTLNSVWTKSGNDVSNNNSGKVSVTGGLVADTLTSASTTLSGGTRLTGGTAVTGGLTADSVNVSSSTLGVITNSTWDGTNVGLAFGGTGASDATTARANLGLSYATSSQLNYYPVVAWGDSLTGGNEDGSGVTYENVLAPLINRVVTNKGIGGNTSTQIAVRQGGVVATATVVGGQIPASGAVTVTFPSGYEPITTSGPANEAGTISGVYGTLTLATSTPYSFNFTRSSAGSVVNVTSSPFVPDNGTLNNGTVVIWAGRNNYFAPSQVESDVAAMVASLGTNQHYMVMSVLNGEYTGEYAGQTNYNTIIALNNYLASTYAGHYLDIRTYLIQHGLSDAGISATASDTADIANDTIPNSLRTDNVHLNAKGYTLVAKQVASYLTSTIDPINNSGVVTTLFLNTAFASSLTSAGQIGNGASTAGYFSSLGIGTTTSSAVGLTVGSNESITLAGGSLQFRTTALAGTAGITASGNGLYLQTGGSGIVPTGDNVGTLGITSQRYNSFQIGTGNSSIAGNLLLGASGVVPISGPKLEVIGTGSTVFGYDATTTNAINVFGKAPLISLIGDGTTNDGPNIGLLQLNIAGSGVNQSASELYLGATRATTANTHAAVGNGDILGRIGFFGDDGTNNRTRAAIVEGDVNTAYQATSTGVVPTQVSIATAFQAPIAFFTNFGASTNSYNTSNGSARMLILPNGNIGIATSTAASKLAVSGGMTVGADYNFAAPNNGLLVEGGVGIGTSILNNAALAINGIASTTNLIISGITNGSAQCLQVDASGNITGTGSACGTGGGGGSPGGSTGQVQFNNGGAFAGSSGLVWNNTTQQFGIGSSTPWAGLSISTTNSTAPQFAVGSSTASSFFITSTGIVSIGVPAGSLSQKLEVNGNIRTNGVGNGGFYGSFMSAGQNAGAISLYGGISNASPGGQIDLTGGTAASNAGSILFHTGTGSTGPQPEIARFNSIGNFGIGTTSPNARVDIVGINNSTALLFQLSAVSSSATTSEFQVLSNGNAVLAGTLTQNSDQRLKTNVQSLEGSSTLASIESLNPVSFNWVNSASGDGMQVGFIAQDVQKIFPNLVSTTSPTALTPNGTLGVNYIGLIAPAIEAIKELATQVNGLAQSITTQVLTAATGNFNQVKTQQLCVGDTCVTEAQLKVLLQQSGQNSMSSQPQAPADNNTSTTTQNDPSESSEASTTPQDQDNSQSVNTDPISSDPGTQPDPTPTDTTPAPSETSSTPAPAADPSWPDAGSADAGTAQ